MMASYEFLQILLKNKRWSRRLVRREMILVNCIQMY